MSTRDEEKKRRRQERLDAEVAAMRQRSAEAEEGNAPARIVAVALVKKAMSDVRIYSAGTGNWQARVAVAGVYALLDIADAIRERP